MKKILSFLLIAILSTGIVSCKNQTQENLTQLGTSDFSIVLPEGYENSEDDFDEDQVAYYYKDDESIDFDVYQWAKDGIYTLEDEAKYYASEYGTEAEEVTVNGIDGMKYISKEDYEGNEYTVVNYMFDDETDIVELCFWTIDSEKEYADVDEIINTLKKN